VNDAILQVQNLTKIFGHGLDQPRRLLAEGFGKDDIYRRTGATVAVDDASFEVAEGETFVIIGLSGSGKSTVVRCINLLHQPTSGRILFAGRDILGYRRGELQEFRRRRMAMVFQSFGLMSHRDLLENVAFGLEIRGEPKAARRAKAFEAIELVGLSGQEGRRIDSLSGGMKQRVGLARALANDPDVLLMDEPFSALDPIVRRDMQAELLKIQARVKKTIVFITHDINEAFKLGDKIAIMKDGKIVQCGTPEDILYRPSSAYVQEFVRDIDKGQALCAWHVLRRLALPGRNAGSGSTEVGDGDFTFILDGAGRPLGWSRQGDPTPAATAILATQLPTVTIGAPLRELLPLLEDGKFANPIAITDANGAFRGYTTGNAVLKALA
jgi:glycine betaine/proline transport system ATP-binding protein